MSWQENLEVFIRDAGEKQAAHHRQNQSVLEQLLDRVEAIEARASSPGRTAGQSAEVREHKVRFESWLRKPHDEHAKARLAEFQTQLEQKDVTVGTGAAGGFAVPEEIVREIERLELLFSPVRSLVRTTSVSTGDAKWIVSERGATSGWVGETGTRTATATPTIRERAPTFGELYAYPKASNWSLDDVFFNVSEWLAEEVAQEFAQQEGDAVIRGDGSTKPTGWLNTTPVVTADFASPLRAAAAYQYIASDLTPGGSGILPDSLIDLVYTLNSAYRSRASWVMNSVTAAAVRKLKDGESNYLWAPGLAGGQPDRLLGYPVAILEQMDDIGANNFPVAFGDWRRAYWLADRHMIRITTDPFTEPGHTKFYVRRREGGCVLNNDAAKFLRTL